MIDIGVNINHSYYLDDLATTLYDSAQAGVSDLVCIASDLEESQTIMVLCEQHDMLWYTIGCHPHHAKDWQQDSLAQARKLIAQSNPVAIGETGLDFNRNYSTPAQQVYAFEQQIELALEFDLPLYLHERDAHDEMLKHLEKYPALTSKSIVHCFTGNPEQLKNYVSLGLSIGITGWVCDERRGQDLQDSLPFIPLDKLHLETDAPYLLPRNIRPRPKRNHPKYLPYVAEEVAKLKNMSVNELIQQTRKNSQTLFGIKPRTI
ncbi:TatD family hydrolase [Marinomonas sp.]